MDWNKLLDADLQISKRLRLRSEQKIRWRLAGLVSHSGDPWYWFIGFIFIWFLGSPAWHDPAAALLLGITAEAIFVLSIKYLVRRSRPLGEWGAIYRLTDPHSFPSGHAARAAVLVVMGLGLGPAWFAILMLINLPLISLSRVMMGVHYLSDVIAGIIVGSFVGFLVLSLLPGFKLLIPFLFQ
jgi:membrane-associated phospholipid phosphatase